MKYNTSVEFDEYFRKQMEDPEMKRLWEEGLPELEAEKAILDAEIRSDSSSVTSDKKIENK